ncbi:Ankyrin [Aphelenchoides bicaudatus]|nr:Ankyrin [Aphelenchoides bicaudatus]
MIQFLVENNAQLESKGVAGFTVLHSAIYFNSNNIEIVRKLIELKADINAQTTNEWTALHLAAMKAGTQLLQLLLDNGAKLEVRDDSGLTPLHHAVSSNKLENTKWFISKGSIEFANIKSVEKWTALHLAAEYGDSEMVKLLVEAGIELEATDYFGRTSLHFAVMSNSYENAKILIANGANVNSQGGCENTPLHYAVRIGSSKLVRLLVEARADTSIKNRDGLTPSQMASKLNYPGISHLLLNEEGPPVTDSQTSEDEKLVDSFYRFGERFSSILSQNVQLKNENLGLRNDVEKIVDELNLMSAKFSSVEDSGRDLSKENLDYVMLLRALEKNMIEDGGASTSSASNEPPNTTRMTCRICLDNLANCAVIVCGHLCLCDECSVGWQENLQSCPCCRQSIEAIVKIII